MRRPGDPRTPCCEPDAEGFARAGGVGEDVGSGGGVFVGSGAGVVVASGVGVAVGSCGVCAGRSHEVSSVTLFQ